MSDENKNAVTESTTNEESNDVPVVPTGDWFDQMSKGLLWLNERAWPLGGCILFISVLYLFGFIVEEQLPLSIISSSIITALPVMFLLVLLFVGILVGFLFSPTIMLFSAIKKKSKYRLADMLVKPTDGGIYLPGKIIAAWFLVPVVLLLVVGIIWLLFYVFNDTPVVVMKALVLLSIPLTVFIFSVLVVKEKSLNLRLRDISADFWISACMSVLPQFLIAVYVIDFSIRLARSHNEELYLFGIAGIFPLCLIQVCGAKFIAEARPDRIFARSFIAGIVVVFALGMYAPTAAKLLGTVLQLTASGARSCAVFTWSSQNPSGIERLHSSGNANQSKPLRILIQVDENYLVRLSGKYAKAEESGKIVKTVYFVPREIVSSIDACPNET